MVFLKVLVYEVKSTEYYLTKILLLGLSKELVLHVMTRRLVHCLSTEKQLMAGPLGSLKSGETELVESRPIRKSKGLEYFLDIRNMGFDQQWKIGEWFKLHPTARLTKRSVFRGFCTNKQKKLNHNSHFSRLSNIFHNSRQPSIRELNAFHVTQQNALRGKIENAWTQRMMDTLWYNLTPDPL